MLSNRAAAAAAALCLCTSTACNRNQAAAAPPPVPPTPVKIAVAEPKPIQDATEYVATLKSLRSTTIQPQTDGQITNIYVKSGDRVHAGDRLMQIDPRRQQAAVSSQEAERASKEAAVMYARQQAQRAAELFKAGAISKAEQEQADTALRTAEADLQALNAQVQQQQVQLRYFTVAAPTDGIVGDVPVRVGMQVSTQTMLTTIDRNETLELNVGVPLERSADLKPGLPIEVLSSDSTRKLALSSISFISPRVDDQTQTILVKGNVKNSNGALRSAQFVRARLIWKITDGLVVPVTAVTRINGEYFAFVAEHGPAGAAGGNGAQLVARQRAIRVGPIVGDDYPVLSGIKQGDMVVTSGIQKLADGAPVAPEP
jgi:RND family efflux transporter MFP subunit